MFGLFDAMSAIEMMDPKMDVGMLCNSSQRQIRSFQQAVDVSVRPAVHPIGRGMWTSGGLGYHRPAGGLIKAAA